MIIVNYIIENLSCNNYAIEKQFISFIYIYILNLLDPLNFIVFILLLFFEIVCT